MKLQKIILKIFQLVLLFSILWMLSSTTTKVNANSQGIDNSNIKIVSPEDDIEKAVEELEAGDTLILKNGIYRQTLSLKGVHGTEEHPITIKAENDGKAIIDGELKRRSVFIRDSSYINVTGIFARDAWSEWTSSVVLIGNSHHINLHRVTAYKSETIHKSAFPFNIDDGSHHIICEDCAGFGSSRKILQVSPKTHHILVRRFFSRWDSVDPNIADESIGSNIYGGERVGYDSVFENVVSFLGDNANDPSSSISVGGGDRHKILGSISYNITDIPFSFVGCSNCILHDSVAINPTGETGFKAKWSRTPYFAPIENNTISNFTWISDHPESIGITLGNSEADRDSLDIRNSFLQGNNSSFAFGLNGSKSQGSVSHSNNILYGFDMNNIYNNYHLAKREAYQDKTPDQIMQEHRETLVSDNPFNSLLPLYGNGAYLMASQTDLINKGENGAKVGADVLYQYESKWNPTDEEELVITTLTDKPLWPWPMEERICAETAQMGDGVNGTSVTYEAHTIEYDYDGDGQTETYNCSGGIWKTLDDVYEDTPSSIDPEDDHTVPTIEPTLTPIEQPTSAPKPQLTPPITTTEPMIINLASGDSITFNCDGKRLALERNNKTQVVGVCRPLKN